MKIFLPAGSTDRRKVVALAVILGLMASMSAPVSAASLDASGGASIPSPQSENKLVAFAQIDFVPNIKTVGVVVSGADLPATANLSYRRSGDATWHPGHPLMRIDDGRLVGSLFGLSPSTTYEVRVSDGIAEINGTVTTQPDQLQFTPANVLYVNDDAPAGGDGSVTAPFRTIQEAVNIAAPGTQVLVADGIYREAVSFPNSGAPGNWIQVKAEGNGAILDGSYTLSGNIWTPVEGKNNVWFTKISASITYLARDQKRFYNYDNLAGLMSRTGHNNVLMTEGWYFEQATMKLYVRTLSDPSRSTWQVPRHSTAFSADARDWLWIEGFEIRFYGSSYGCGICLRNASHVVIRRNRIHNIQLGVYTNWTGGEDRGNDARIEYNEIYDPPVNEWPWKAVKGTSMEGTGIVVRGHIGAIVRGNEIHRFFNGIYTGSSGALENPALAFDADIYNNRIHHISDDGLEPEGACINHRFRNNTIDAMLVGISLAPVTQGPTWVLRSTFTNFTGTSMKWDRNSDGFVLIYHNTSWTNAADLNAMSMISPARNVVMRNNIFRGNGYAFEEAFTGSSAIDWNYNNWNTARGANKPHFKWENVNYDTIAKLCAGTGLECNGYEDPPGLKNPNGGDFTLLPSSPNIDRGILIPGINDNFGGNAPDAGAYESALAVDSPPAVLSILRADANPTNAASVNFTVAFSETVSGVDIVPPFADFALFTSAEITGASITSVAPVSGTTYTVNVNTGLGNGIIRLDLTDDDSITDAGGNPLGGAGAGNGNFSAGQEYTINKTQTQTPTATVTETFSSNGGNDGWVLESGENTNKGGSLDKNSGTINVGDHQKDRQYRGILSFDTGALPDDATIVSAQLIVKRQGFAGTDPFTTHGPLLLEIRNGSFHNSVRLQNEDFSAPASAGSGLERISSLTSALYAANLSAINLGLVNKTGITQFRLSFSKDDNDDLSADYIKFFSGDSAFENRPQLIVVYAAASGGTNAPAQPSNQPPVITSNGGLATASISIPENSSAVAMVTATDADLPAQTLVYSISGGADASLFGINPSTGELFFVAAPNYEVPMDAGADNVYNVIVQVSDGNLSAAQEIAVSITAVDDNPPAITSNGGGPMVTLSVAENSTMVTTVTATDADLPAEALTYSISGGADPALFNINSSTGELTFIAPPDYEVPLDSNTNNIYYVQVRAASGTLTAIQDIAVMVVDVNDNAPVFSSPASAEAPENTTTVMTVSASDADPPAQILTYSMIGGADSALFSINPGTGELVFLAAPDYEHPTDAGLDNTYNVTIQASDGTLTASQDIAVTVTPVNDNAPVITSYDGLATASVNAPENAASVTTVTAADADLPAQTLIYSITGGADSALFSVNSTTGELTFIAAPDYEAPADAGADNVYNVTITVSDGTLTAAQNLDVFVAPVNDNNPIITSNGGLATASVNVTENLTAITAVTATDADLPAQTLTHSISGGADSALFNINALTGHLTFIAPPDFETPTDNGLDNIYNVTVQVSDGAFLAIQDIAVTVTDIDENAAILPIYDFNTFNVIGYMTCAEVPNYTWNTSPCNGESGGCWISAAPLFGHNYAGFQRHEGNQFCGLNIP
jgi:hypothetical protein